MEVIWEKSIPELSGYLKNNIVNILLATHNYYPYNYGGTEVYVASLAQYLVKLKHEISIVAAVNDEAFNTNPVIFEDDNLRVCTYHYQEITVFGVQYKKITTQQIYARQSHEHQKSWTALISTNDTFKKIDLLHVNGFTPTIGLDLIYATKASNRSIKVISSYHTAISCAKETLLFANTLTEQHDTIDDVADMFSYRLNIPYYLAKIISSISPNVNISFLPTIFNLKNLTKQILNSFKQLNELTDEWWVYSEGIKNHLVKKGIAADKLIFERHGIAPFFFNKERISVPPYKFLYSGRTIKSKGFNTLLNAWLKLNESADKQLWITGYPISDDKKIKALIKQTSNRKDIIWLGSLDQQAIAKIYLSVNTVIIPSEVYEIGPLVFHEAIASGCSVISSDIGGCKELAEYYHTRSTTFKAGNVADLSDKILLQINKSDALKPEAKVLTFDMHFESIIIKSKMYD